ncbi:MAG: Plug domain-containing protein, partial [Desulfobacteraceae bacterium]|nr:Plug domain-containing protein [Desulfobacteraceae bacterium]
MKRTFFRIWMLVLLLPMSAMAEEQEQKSYQMQEVEVIASPVIEGTSVNALGSSVTTISKEQLDALNVQDLPAALRKTPGVVISRHNPVGSFGGGEGGSVFIRGQGSSRPGAEIQMNIDGIPKFVSVWTHPLMDVLSIDIIDHIDVYKGAQPVLFGNMAFGAVQLHSKKQTQEGFSTNFETAYGSFDTWIEVAEHGGKIKDFA